ncbi:hypothetical protein MAM1_0009d01030 [Mucor ambiguus]|uniref:protein-tyrosine-phosphatase n=1 Tax=Mucor ambiguus TaxID=91626 RepID=A0A0C9M0H2_9FUNG|nr:hypothetical protein MAM1_0009d01030 [Mucor ambiguus]
MNPPAHSTKKPSSPLNITTEHENSNGIMDRLSAAFRSQTSLADTRSSTSSNSSRPTGLRKRSSGSFSHHYRPASSTQDSIETTSKRRDSNGINYSNFISAMTDYQQNKGDQDPPLFTISNGSNALLAPSSPNSTVATTNMTTPTLNSNNRGRIAKRLSATFNNNSITNTPIHHNPHGNSTNASKVSKVMKDTKPIEPAELGHLLQQQDTVPPLLIDMRPLEVFEKSHIRNSININVPTLLVKRYRRGVVSNFNLESFITTPEGTDLYRAWLKRYQLEDIQFLPQHAQCILYDDQMIDDASATWILMGVLAQNTNCSVQWLHHGYEGFNHWDFTHTYQQGTLHLRSALSNSPPVPLPSTSKSQLFTNKLKMPIPMVSRSATTLSHKNNMHHNVSNSNVQRRASLFSLDTTSMRKGHNNSIASTNAFRQRNSGSHPTMSSITEPTTANNLFSPEEDVFHTPLEQLPTSDDQHPMMTALGDLTPKTENEYDFVISEIIPNFLYLGPEIVTADQVSGLRQRSIKRVLNMAEECDDDVPGLKENFAYQKIAARDTVEMQNVQGTLKKAVQVIGKRVLFKNALTCVLTRRKIDDSKKHHEPIYVHCKAGKSRSAAAILAYLVISENWTLKKAYRHIAKARPNISPNIGFVAELMKMEEGVHGQVSNFAGTDWHLADLTNPPSPDTQKEMGRLEKAWKRGRSSSNVRSRSTSSVSNSRVPFPTSTSQGQQQQPPPPPPHGEFK